MLTTAGPHICSAKTKHVRFKELLGVVFLRVYYSAGLGSFTTRLQILLLKYRTSPLKSQETHDTHQPMESTEMIPCDLLTSTLGQWNLLLED
jgi:hypothetical protein